MSPTATFPRVGHPVLSFAVFFFFFLLAALFLPPSLQAESSADLAWNGVQAEAQSQHWGRCHHQIGIFLKQYPGDSREFEAIYLRGLCQARLGKPAEALREWAPFLLADSSADPLKSPWVPKVLATALEMSSRDAGKLSIQREQWLERLIRQHPACPETAAAIVAEMERRISWKDGASAGLLLEDTGAILSPELKESFSVRLMVLSLVGAGDLNAMLDQAQAWAGKGKLGSAALLYQEILKKGRWTDETQRQAALDLGRLHRSSGSTAEALGIWEKILVTAQKDDCAAQARYERAVTLASVLKQPEEARTEFQALLEAHPHTPLENQALLQMAQLALAQENEREARSLLARVKGEAGDSALRQRREQLIAEANELLARQVAAAELAAQPSDPSADLLLRARQLFEAEDFAAARRVLRPFILQADAVHPDYLQAKLLFARCLAAESKFREALFEFDALLADALDAADPFLKQEIWFGIGLARLHSGENLSLARLAFQAAAGLEGPWQREARLQQAIACLAEGDRETARKLCAELDLRLENIDPEKPLTGPERLLLAALERQSFTPPARSGSVLRSERTRLADSFFTAMDYKRALSHYEAAFRQASAEEEKGYCLLQQARSSMQLLRDQETERLLSRFQGPLKSNPWAAEGLIRLGVFYLGPREDAAAAEKVFRAITLDHPEDPQAERAQFYLVLTMAWTKKAAPARRELQLLSARYPNSAFLSGAQTEIASLH